MILPITCSFTIVQSRPLSVASANFLQEEFARKLIAITSKSLAIVTDGDVAVVEFENWLTQHHSALGMPHDSSLSPF